jgi:hypothetical protein
MGAAPPEQISIPVQDFPASADAFFTKYDTMTLTLREDIGRFLTVCKDTNLVMLDFEDDEGSKFKDIWGLWVHGLEKLVVLFSSLRGHRDDLINNIKTYDQNLLEMKQYLPARKKELEEKERALKEKEKELKQIEVALTNEKREFEKRVNQPLRSIY